MKAASFALLLALASTLAAKEQTVPVDDLVDVQGLEGRGAGTQMSLWVKDGAARARQMGDGINAGIQLALTPPPEIGGKAGLLRAQVTEPPLAFTGVYIVDVVAGQTSPARTVVIAGGRIASLDGPVPPQARRIPADGLYVIPGLWDMHVHLRSAARRPDAPLIEENAGFLDLFLPHGVLGIREMGGDLADTVLRWRGEINTGKRIGPRILTAGRKIDGAPPAWPGSLTVTTPQEARAAVRQMKQSGVDFIKANFNRADLTLLQAVTDEAHKHNLRVTGHWPFNLPVQLLPESGMDAIEHSDHLIPPRPADFEQFQRESDARRGTAWGLGLEEIFARRLYLRDPANAGAFYRTLAARPVWITPTLVVEQVLRVDLATRDFTSDTRARFIFPALWQTWDLKTGLRSAPQGRSRELLIESVGQSRRAVAAAHQAGVPMIAGSDCGANNNYLFPGWSLHDELEMLVRSGITPADALRMATINAARWRGDADREGSLEVGKAAELVLLRGNPLTRIGNTREVESVVRGGHYYSRADLDRMLGDVERRVRSECEDDHGSCLPSGAPHPGPAGASNNRHGLDPPSPPPARSPPSRLHLLG